MNLAIANRGIHAVCHSIAVILVRKDLTSDNYKMRAEIDVMTAVELKMKQEIDRSEK